MLRGVGKEYYYIDIFDKDKGKQRHVPIHRIVYTSWVDDIEECQQVNHKDDNTKNNTLQNLYVGNQADNIVDCKNNKHRVGNVCILKLFDTKLNKEVEFCPANNFIDYSGHTNKSGSIQKMFDKQWFKTRYKILKYEK